MTGPGPVVAPRRAALAFIFVTVVLDMLALGMIIPVLPGLIEDFMGGDTARAARIFGVFGSVWALMQFVSMPIMGGLSDRFGRRPVILLSNLGLGLDYVLMALAPNLRWLFVGRIISGITAASISTAMAYVADVTPPEKRAKSYGLIGMAFGVGFVLGPALGGLLGSVDPRLPFWAAAACSLANAAYGYFVLPESLPVASRRRFEWRRANPIGSLKFLRSHAELAGLAGAAFLSNLAHAVLPAVFVLYAGYRFGWSEKVVGLALAAVGASSVVVQGTLIGPSVQRFGERRVLLAGLTAGAVRFSRVRARPDAARLSLRYSDRRAVGTCGTLCAGADDSIRRAFRTRRIAGRHGQPAGYRDDDRAGHVCGGFRVLDRSRQELALPRRGIRARVVAAAGVGTAGRVHDSIAAGAGMTATTIPALPAEFAAGIAENLAALAARTPREFAQASVATAAELPYVWACSAFTTHACLRDARLLEWLDSDEARLRADADRAAFMGWVAEAMAACAPGNDSEFMKALRIFRRRHLVRIAWRDLAKLAPIDTVLRELSWLAEACIGAACRFATATLQQRHGVPKRRDGSELSLLVLGMGKLGGGELNYSSDIDLVFLFPEHGETTGPRPLEHEEFFVRAAKRVAQLLGSVTDEGFVYRVDLQAAPVR